MFETLLGDRGKRGLSIIVAESDIGPVFFLQARAVDAGQEPPSAPSPVTVATEVAITFCPWCRADLRRRYGHQAADLATPDLRLH
jgi:hypothetical protein